eukprot:2777897-Lingulodinium_polyedra.AAC.1
MGQTAALDFSEHWFKKRHLLILHFFCGISRIHRTIITPTESATAHCSNAQLVDLPPNRQRLWVTPKAGTLTRKPDFSEIRSWPGVANATST